jgi:putative toxin-antitoxin system antitoxin component (TIGR02293 family)
MRLPIIESLAICLYNWGILPQHDREESMMQSGKDRESVVLAVFHKLGGRSALGRDIASTADLARMVTLRIPLKSLEHLTRSGSFSDEEISDLVIPARTHRHRKQKHERLSVEESDRLVRLTRIQALAEDVFQDIEKANTWLRAPLGELSNEKPLEIAQTEAGARVVEQILAKIDWGAAA